MQFFEVFFIMQFSWRFRLKRQEGAALTHETDWTRMGILESILEGTVVPSFSSVGSRLRRRTQSWKALESYDLKGKNVVLTGATSGIGYAAALLYAKLGATLLIVGRSPDKTSDAVKKLRQLTGNEQVTFTVADLADLQAVRQAAKNIQEQFESVDVLAHNAGALFNQRKRTANGTDLAIELMVSAPYLLTGLLLPQLSRASTGRVILMSSGGMYTQALPSELEMPDSNYSGVKQYAIAKRAQVVLNELWAERIPESKIVFHSLHPGWVDTPGITEALPGFSTILGPLGLLRTAREGADTLVWLSVDPSALKSTGNFWHDRAIRSTHKMRATRAAETLDNREALWRWCEQQTGWSLFLH